MPQHVIGHDRTTHKLAQSSLALLARKDMMDGSLCRGLGEEGCMRALKGGQVQAAQLVAKA